MVPRPVPDAPTESTAGQDPELDAVIAEYLTAIQAGQRPDRGEILRRHPELVRPLEEFFADYDYFQHLAGQVASNEARQPPPPCTCDSTLGPAGSSAAAVPPPLRQFGDYVLTAEIARGGMGVVYRATQTSLKRPVALKMILAGQLASAADVQRFQREAEAAARLDHPQIVPIYEVGEHAGTHYFSMKLVDGGNLTQRLPQLVGDSRAVAELIATLAEAIHHAHQRGILHRDLKPRNILLDAAGVPQITDFGLAKQVDASGELTQSGAIVGTAGYMAPEQARGERTITTAVDVYSLGAILYELLTGRPPFRGATPAETILRVRADEPVRPTAIRPDVDRDLETVCLKCLEKDPLRRYPSAAALAEDVRRWLAGLPITARPAGPAERLWRWCRRNPVLAVGGVLVLALSGVFSWSLWDENCETRAALAREGQALAQAQLARDEAQDHLARSLYEQARGLALSAPAESRWRILGLLEQSRVLQRRPRAGGGATAEQRQRLPNASELRSEAVGALLRHDLRLAWQRNMQGAQPALVGDGRRVIFREGTSLVFLDWAQRQELNRWSATEISGTALAVDVSGRWLAAWSPQGGQVNVWDLASGTRTQTLPWPPRADSAAPEPEGRFPLVSSDLSWSPDAQRLAAVDRRAGPAGRQALVLWNLSGNGPPRSLTNVSQDTDRGGAQFTADGSQIAYPTGADTLTFWQTATSDPSRAVRLPLPIVGGWELDASGRRLVGLCAGAGEHAGTLVVWDLADDREVARVPTEFSLKGAVVALDPAGRRAALGTRDGRLCVVALATGQKLINRAAAHPFAIGRLGWNRDGSQLASWGVVDGGFRCWEVADPPAIDVRTSPKLRHFTFSPDGQRLAAADAQEPRIRVVDRTAGAADHDLWGSDPARPGLLVFSPDGRQLAEINAYCVVVWDLAARQLLVRLEQASGLEGLITSVAFSPEGRLLAAVASASEPRVAVWDVLGCRQVWRAPADSALTLGYLVPGGRLLAGIGQPSLTSPAQMSVIEFSTGRLAAQVAAPRVPVDWNSFSPDGQWLATLRPTRGDAALALFASAGTAIDSELVLCRFPENDRQVIIGGSTMPSATAFSPDSRLLAIGYCDGFVRLSRVDDGAEIFRSQLRSRPIIQLAFSSDGATLAVTDGFDGIQLLDLPSLHRGLASIGLDWE